MAGRRGNRSSIAASTNNQSAPGKQSAQERILQKVPTLQQSFTSGGTTGGTNGTAIPPPKSIQNNGQDNQSMDTEGTEKVSPFKKFFPFKRKGGGRRKEKKARQNRRLRKMLTPKTALMALNELKGKLSQYTVTGQGTNFTAEINVNGVVYEGNGNSKIAAKNAASEKALREIIIQKMAKVPKKSVEINHKPSPSDGTNEENEDVEMKNADSDDEDVPMIHLASFALHKLFSEWESQGYQIPDFRSGPGNATSTEDVSVNDERSSSVGPKKIPKPRTELPPNAETLHPCTVLSHMRPAIAYNDLGFIGTPPNAVHKVSVTIDGNEFIAEARSKKNARKFVAIKICNELFGTQFVKEDESAPA